MINRVFTFLLLLVISGCCCHEYCKSSNHNDRFTFDADPVGLPPAGFTAYLTGDTSGKEGNWIVQRDPSAVSGDHVLTQISTDKTDHRFPVLINNRILARNVDATVHFKSVAGEVDEGAGIVIRFRDPQSYYVARANALEDNVRLYKMVNGQRIQFAGKDMKITARQWHTLRLLARGDHFEVFYDHQKVIDATDDTYNLAGKAGLWTKADSVSSFDNFEVINYDKGAAR